MTDSNRHRLQAYVDSGLRRARGLDRGDAAALLRTNAEVVRRHLDILARWAAESAQRPCPPHLQGLTAFELADAAERLEAEAARCSGAPLATAKPRQP